MFKNFFPNKILSLTNKTINSLIISLVVVITIGLTYSLLLSPPDYIQGDSVRIMYVHVPSSFIALSCFGFIGVASICNLVFKIKFMPLLAKSLAPIGCIFFINFNCNRFILGKTYLGNMVGLGCEINIYVNFVSFLHCVHLNLEIHG